MFNADLIVPIMPEHNNSQCFTYRDVFLIKLKIDGKVRVMEIKFTTDNFHGDELNGIIEYFGFLPMVPIPGEKPDEKTLTFRQELMIVDGSVE